MIKEASLLLRLSAPVSETLYYASHFFFVSIPEARGLHLVWSSRVNEQESLF